MSCWGRVLGGLSALVLVGGLAGCTESGQGKGGALGPGAEKLLGKTPDPHSYVGDHVQVANLNSVTIIGIGLVNGLDYTGGPAPSGRSRMLMFERMKKLGVQGAAKILASNRTALVRVEGELRPGVRKGDRFDVTVQLVPGDTETVSLEGGVLLETLMAEYFQAPGSGDLLPTDVKGAAEGPVFVMPEFAGRKRTRRQVTQGVVLGGGAAKISRNLMLLLRRESRGVRTSRYVGSRINRRFFETRRDGFNQGMATPLDDLRIELRVPAAYRDNLDRYCRVIASIAMSDSLEDRDMLLEQLARDLESDDRAKQARAGLRLEAIGRAARGALVRVLRNGRAQARFVAADVLAFLDDEAGVTVLTDVLDEGGSTEQREAIEALLHLDSPVSRMALRRALCHPNTGIRLAAFNGLQRLGDRSVAGRRIGKHVSLHSIQCPDHPLVYVRRQERPQLALYGSGLNLLTPLFIELERFTIRAHEGQDHCMVVRYDLSRDRRGRVDGPSTRRARCTLALADVLEKMAKMGATYDQLVAVVDRGFKSKSLLAGYVLESASGSGLRAALSGSDARPERKADSENSEGRRPTETATGRTGR